MSTLDNIKNNFEQIDVPMPYKGRGEVVENATKKAKITLKANEKEYKLSELQDIATQLKIDLTKLGKKGPINRTRLDLFQEIKKSV